MITGTNWAVSFSLDYVVWVFSPAPFSPQSYFLCGALHNRRHSLAASRSDAKASALFADRPSRGVQGIQYRKLRLFERISEIEGKRS